MLTLRCSSFWKLDKNQRMSRKYCLLFASPFRKSAEPRSIVARVLILESCGEFLLSPIDEHTHEYVGSCALYLPGTLVDREALPRRFRLYRLISECQHSHFHISIATINTIYRTAATSVLEIHIAFLLPSFVPKARQFAQGICTPNSPPTLIYIYITRKHRDTNGV